MNDDLISHGQGDYRGDFTRDSFNPINRFSRVLMQQGRVQLDADWNEQASILLHYLRTLTTDLIGPHWCPSDEAFVISLAKDKNGAATGDVTIGAGHYYVDGILCESDGGLSFATQPGAPFFGYAQFEKNRSYLLFLDVWERHLTLYENPAIGEVALGGTDTASRAQVVWQVKAPVLTAEEATGLEKPMGKNPPSAADIKVLKALVDEVTNAHFGSTAGLLSARANAGSTAEDLCTLSSESKFRGLENQLYRVEIHKGGLATENDKPDANTATFKWSRDNSSVTFPIVKLNDDTVVLANLGRDSTRGLKVGDCVEIIDDTDVLRGQSGPLLRIKEIRPDDTTVVLTGDAKRAYNVGTSEHPLLRRWDYTENDPLTVAQSPAGAAVKWITLEDGVQIAFSSGGAAYRSGDYWLVPARVATGDVIWPKEKGKPVAQIPHGVRHHYAPLASVKIDGDGKVASVVDLRTVVKLPV